MSPCCVDILRASESPLWSGKFKSLGGVQKEIYRANICTQSRCLHVPPFWNMGSFCTESNYLKILYINYDNIWPTSCHNVEPQGDFRIPNETCHSVLQWCWKFNLLLEIPVVVVNSPQLNYDKITPAQAKSMLNQALPFYWRFEAGIKEIFFGWIKNFISSDMFILCLRAQS